MKNDELNLDDNNVDIADLEIGVSDDGVFDIEKEELLWSDLSNIHNELSKTILEQQHLVLGLYNVYKDVVDNDRIIKATLEGLSISIKNFSEDIMNLQSTYSGKTGCAKDIDSRMDYISIASTYVGINEKLANIMATSYLDVFTKLSVSSKDIASAKEAIEAGKQSVKDVNNGK